MDNNQKYSIEDLVTNESFLNFYFQKVEEDTLDWEEWRDEHPNNALAVAQAFDLLNRLSLKWDANFIQEHWQLLHEQIRKSEILPEETVVEHSRHPITLNLWKLAGVAAVFLICLSVGIGWWQTSRKTDGPLQFVNEHANRLMIYKLPDGTRIQLKPYSRLEIGQNFGVESRDIWLSGEATFEVAKDSIHPFRVFSENLSVTALGTVFNFRAISGEPENKVMLLEGSVRVENTAQHTQNHNTDILQPGEEISYKVQEKRLLPKRKISTPAPAPRAEIKSALQAGSWIQFNQTAFADVATSLEYNFGIHFTGISPQLRDMPVNYRFRGDKNLKNILDDLSKIASFEYTIRGKEIQIKMEMPPPSGGIE